MEIGRPVAESALVGAGTGIAAGTASAIGHVALRRSIAEHPEGALGQRFWQVRPGGVTRATAGATIMFATAGLTAGALNAFDVSLLGDGSGARLGQAALAGSVVGGALTWVHPIFHGRQLGTPRSMVVNMALGAVVGAGVHAAHSAIRD